jgi:hypothetical protein
LFGVILPYEDNVLSAFTRNYKLDQIDFDRMWDNAIEFLRKSSTERIGILPCNYILSVNLMDGNQTSRELPTQMIALRSDIKTNGWSIAASLPMIRDDMKYGSVAIHYNQMATTHFGRLSNETTAIQFLHSIKIPNIFEVLSYKEVPTEDAGQIWVTYEDD